MVVRRHLEIKSHQRGVRKGGCPLLADRANCVHIYVHKAVEIPVSVGRVPPPGAGGGRQSQGIRDCAYLSVRSALTPVFVDAHSPCCMQYACDLSVHMSLGQRAVDASPLPGQRLLGTLVTREEVYLSRCPALGLKGLCVSSADSCRCPGHWTRQDRDGILDSGAVLPETSPHPSLGCVSSWGVGGRKPSLGRRDCQMPGQSLFFL